MTRLPALLAAALCAVLLGTWAAPASAQNADTYKPTVGQEGKDVIWVPTPPALVERMLRMAQVTARDFVVDLGSGDGRIPIAAAKTFGARAMGIEYNPDMVRLSVRLARETGVADKVQMVEGDIFEKDFASATVVTTYLLTELNLRLRPKLLDMKPGTRVVAHLFGMGDWQPDETSVVEGRPAFLWIVPARVNGRWKVSLPMAGSSKTRQATLDIEQQFQKISGVINFGRMNTTLRDPLLRGDAIRFWLTDEDGRPREYAGRVAGNSMSGSVGRQRWTAEKADAAKP
ncbi:MAG TPA: class I SAM-dependent methyltransferase [Burkholderiales bacterium]|nr:class I SAM-dependent methyltransferase [Burkholderiales bacterium]